MNAREAGDGGIEMRAVGPAFTTLKRDDTFGHRPARGTVDWMRYSAIMDVPADAQSVISGFVLNGRGKMWMDEVTLEILEP